MRGRQWRGLVVVLMVVVWVAVALPVGAQEPGEVPTEVELLQSVLEVVIKVAVPPLLLWAVASWERWLARRRQTEEWALVEEVVRRAVQAAEQMGLSDQLSTYAGAKLDYALDVAEAWLHGYGLALDLERLRALVEAEVLLQFPRRPDGGVYVTASGMPYTYGPGEQ